MNTKHTRKSWYAMFARCTDRTHPAYARYGGRGISICERWKSFDLFLEDMGPRPQDKTLDRINNDGNYEPQNCRWATSKEQHRNTPLNRFITHNGKTLCTTDWSLALGGHRTLVSARLLAGWDEQSAVSVPHKYHKTHCKRGHEYNEENTRYAARGRVCKICEYLLRRERRALSKVIA